MSIVAVYNNEGELAFTTHSHKDIKDKLNVSYTTISRGIKKGWRIAEHTARLIEDGEEIPQRIEVDKKFPKFRSPDGRHKRMYLLYHVDGTIAIEKPMFMDEATEYLGVTKHTIMDGINKNHLCNAHIIRVARSKTRFPKKLTPFAKEFKVFQYNKAGELVGYFTTISVTSRKLKIPYDTIRNSIVKGVSTDENYFFTDHIPLSGYKKIAVNFKSTPKIKKVRVSQGIQLNNVLMTLNKACETIGTTYITLKKKMENEKRIIYKGFLIEQASGWD